MIVKICIVLLLAGVAMLFVVPGIVYFSENVKEGYFKSFRRKPLTSMFLLLLIAGAAAVHVCRLPNDWYSFVESAQSQCVWSIILLIATIDFFVKKIPNALVVGILCIRCVAIICLIVMVPSGWGILLGKSVIGFLAGVLFLGTCYLVSRGGLGAGDLKLYCSLGFCYGFYGIMAILLYSLLVTVVIGVVLLVSHKAKFKTTIPMAPFALIGLTVFLLIS